MFLPCFSIFTTVEVYFSPFLAEVFFILVYKTDLTEVFFIPSMMLFSFYCGVSNHLWFSPQVLVSFCVSGMIGVKRNFIIISVSFSFERNLTGVKIS